jgi:hypothetical protein
VAKEHYMAKEKADSDKRGWFARWRERRAQSKLRASEIEHRAYDARSKDEQRPERPVGTRGYGGP